MFQLQIEFNRPTVGFSFNTKDGFVFAVAGVDL